MKRILSILVLAPMLVLALGFTMPWVKHAKGPASSGGAGGSDPDLVWIKMNGSGTTLTADVGPNWTTDGTQASGYVDFDGTNDATASSSVTYGTDTITVSLWVNADDTTGAERHIFNTTSAGNYNDKTLVVYTDSSALHVSIWGTDLSSLTRHYSITEDTWFHLVVVADNSTETGSLSVYKDGSLATPTSTTSTKTGSGNFITAAPKIGGAAANYDGFIDDVRVYTGALDATAIGNLFTAGRQ